MDNIPNNYSEYLGKNLTSLRKKANLSQEKLAKLAQTPRSTLTYLESGEGNPTLNNLVKISAALNVTIEELISVPRSPTQHYLETQIKSIKQKNGLVEVLKLLPDPIPGMEIDNIIIKPGGHMKGAPHVAHSKEYLYCYSGKVDIFISGEKHSVNKGELFAFPGDTKHAYVNPQATSTSKCFSVVAFSR